MTRSRGHERLLELKEAQREVGIVEPRKVEEHSDRAQYQDPEGFDHVLGISIFANDSLEQEVKMCVHVPTKMLMQTPTSGKLFTY